jgi:hypothetical protein
MNFMKRLSFLTIALCFICIGCSTEDSSLTENGEQNLVIETENLIAVSATRVSFTGNQNLAVHARIGRNGAASGFWRDSQARRRVNVDCIHFFSDQMGIHAILTGIISGGTQRWGLHLVDGVVIMDRASMPMPRLGNCGDPLSLMPFPINGGNVTIN